MTAAAATAPIATAWLTKLVLDRLVSRTGAVGGLAVALACAGLAVAALPVVVHYVRAQIGRAASTVATDGLFAALGRQVGLRTFENPAYQDRLRLAQESCGRMPEIVDGVGGTLSGTLSLAGFLGSLFILSPAMTGVVLAAAIPALLAELLLARRRAAVEWRVERFARREFFYSQLLTGIPAATEIRLFGIGAFLRARLMDERRSANAAQRRMDERELRTMGGLTALSAAVAGAGLWWAITSARDGSLSSRRRLDVRGRRRRGAGRAGHARVGDRQRPGPAAVVRALRRRGPRGTRSAERFRWPGTRVAAGDRAARRLVPLQRRPPVGAARGGPHPPARRGGRARRPQRRGQEHAREAVVPHVRPDARADPLGRRRPARHPARVAARADQRGVPGPHELRHDRGREHRARRSRPR